MELNERLSILKQQENDCYRICFYLLQSEKLACEAAENALSNLIQTDSFFIADMKAKTELLRKESMKAALQIKKQSVCGLL